MGAAIGAGIGAEIFTSTAEAFANMRPLQVIEPFTNDFESIYQDWKALLQKQLSLLQL
jgi:xylulokinase